MDRSKPTKTQVLKDEMAYLCEELGDPGRYIPSLRAKSLLDSRDSEQIKAQPTNHQKTEVLLDIILRREGNSSEHPLDILITELKKQRVQVHIARRLQRTLKKRQRDSDDGASGVASGSVSQEQQQQSMASYGRQPSHTSFVSGQSAEQVDGHSTQTSPPTKSYPQYEVDPDVGPIPGPPPSRTTAHTSYPHNGDFHPEHGLLPSMPPPTSQQTQPERTMAQNTHPNHSHDSGPISKEAMFNSSSSDVGGQSISSYPSMDTYTSATFTATSGFSQVSENEKHLQDQVAHLELLLAEAHHKIHALEKELQSTKQEMTHARKELASYRSASMHSQTHANEMANGIRHEPLARPGSLFPAFQDQRHMRQISPARADVKYSTGSQGDNLSIRSANSNTSVNSNSSLGNTPRFQIQGGSYV